MENSFAAHAGANTQPDGTSLVNSYQPRVPRQLADRRGRYAEISPRAVMRIPRSIGIEAVLFISLCAEYDENGELHGVWAGIPGDSRQGVYRNNRPLDRRSDGWNSTKITR